MTNIKEEKFSTVKNKVGRLVIVEHERAKKMVVKDSAEIIETYTEAELLKREAKKDETKETKKAK